MNTRENILLKLVRTALWGTQAGFEGRRMNGEQYQDLMVLAREQTVVGLVTQGLMVSGVKMDGDDVPVMYAAQQLIRQRNGVMDEAVVALCRRMAEAGIRIVVMKGQTLAVHYPDPGLRQSGDIDFYCHPEDWEKAVNFFRFGLKLYLEDRFTEKDVEFTMDGVAYEMHNKMTLFGNPWYSRYWEKVVIPEMLAHPYFIKVNGYDVPTMAPIYNVLYVFIHIFQHMLSDGIGLRQFCDWAVIMDKYRDEVDWEVFAKHLNKLGMMGAFTGLGAVLTDYLGFNEAVFPYKISDKDHHDAETVMKDVLELGNFGHNQGYKNAPGIKHGIEHIGKIYAQSRKFYHYAPAEVRWKIPYMFKWWGIKLWRMMAPK